MTMRKKIKVDVVSDVACPWCYIGKRRLENAINQVGNEFDIEVTFQPFQLDPRIPKEGKDWKAYFEGKFGDAERIDEIFHRVESAGRSVGVDFKFKSIPRIPNTLGLHLILEQAKKEGIQAAVANVLFDAYMVHPLDLTNIQVLIDLMVPFGWDSEKTTQVLSNKENASAVEAKIKHFQQLGVSGVPFFIINDEYGISGAQPEDVLIQAFRSLQQEPVNEGEGASCDIESGEC
jgi:predicted DsbA family dithiol-disulfide isomerase